MVWLEIPIKHGSMVRIQISWTCRLFIMWWQMKFTTWSLWNNNVWNHLFICSRGLKSFFSLLSMHLRHKNEMQVAEGNNTLLWTRDTLFNAHVQYPSIYLLCPVDHKTIIVPKIKESEEEGRKLTETKANEWTTNVPLTRCCVVSRACCCQLPTNRDEAWCSGALITLCLLLLHHFQ